MNEIAKLACEYWGLTIILFSIFMGGMIEITRAIAPVFSARSKEKSSKKD